MVEKEKKKAEESIGKNSISSSVDKATAIGEVVIGKTSELMFSILGTGIDMLSATGMDKVIKKAFINEGTKKMLKKLATNEEIREFIGELVKDAISPKKPEK